MALQAIRAAADLARNVLASSPPIVNPAPRKERERSSSRIPERKRPRKQRRPRGLDVVEAPLPPAAAAARDEAATAPGGKQEVPATPPPKKRPSPAEEKDEADEAEATKRRHTYRRLGKDDDDSAALDLLPPLSFAEDYFVCPALARQLKPGVARALAAQEEPNPTVRAATHGGPAWLRRLQLGFSLLVQGFGSKRRILEAFANDVLTPWGAAVVIMEGYDPRFSLVETLRDVLEQLYAAPRSGARVAQASAEGAAPERRSASSVEGLAAAVRSARELAAAPVRPLCLVMHNLELIPPAHQAALAGLAAAPGVHLVASVDSIWASFSWHPGCLKDFNFCVEEVHTLEGHEAEAQARHLDGLPIWSDPLATKTSAAKASLGLVLRSLTRSHRELVEVIAKHQLENGGRTGISTSKLLGIATDHMIASSATKLRSLLNELRDHEVVGQKVATDGGTLFHLQCSGKVLERLAEGLAPEESDAEDSDIDVA